MKTKFNVNFVFELGWYKGEKTSFVMIDLLSFSRNYIWIFNIKIAKFCFNFGIVKN